MGTLNNHRVSAYKAIVTTSLLVLTTQTASLGESQSEPANARQTFTIAQPVNPPPSRMVLQGLISTDHYLLLEQRVTELVDIANQRRADSAQLAARHDHFGKLSQRAFAAGKDLLELATEYRGFEQSSEAADVILDEKLRLKSKSACDWAKQVRRDRLERDIFASMMQISLGIGSSDPVEGKQIIAQGLDKLKLIVGEEEAQKTLNILQDWCSAIKIDETCYNTKPWNILEAEDKSKSVLDIAMKNDPVVSEIKGRLHRYNGRSKFARATAKVVNTSLSIAGLSPTFISPAAQVAWAVYIATQGGPEEAKLLKEVYLGRRFESRFNIWNERATLAVNSYNMALVTKNPALLSVSEYMLKRMETAKAVALAPGTKKVEAQRATDNSAESAKTEPSHEPLGPQAKGIDQAASIAALKADPAPANDAP